jgi:hypothetical protein
MSVDKTTDIVDKRKVLTRVILVVVAVIILAIGSYFIFQKPVNTPVHSNAPVYTKLTDESARKIFVAFVTAVKNKDQTSADALSTQIFKTIQVTTFNAADGKWLSSKKLPNRNIISIINALPTLTVASPYIQSQYIGSDGKTKGITLRYQLDASAIKSASLTGTPEHTLLSLSLVIYNGKVAVDSVLLYDPNPTPTTIAPTTQPVQPNIDAVKKH